MFKDLSNLKNKNLLLVGLILLFCILKLAFGLIDGVETETSFTIFLLDVTSVTVLGCVVGATETLNTKISENETVSIIKRLIGYTMVFIITELCSIMLVGITLQTIVSTLLIAALITIIVRQN